MATIEIVTRSCDWCGYEDEPNGTNVQPHIVAIDHIMREIDGCVNCATENSSWLAQVGRAPAVNQPKRRERTAATRRESEKIRAWAVAQELLPPGGKGRLPGKVVTAYENR